MSSVSTNPTRKIVAVVALVAITIAAYLVFRPQPDATPTATANDYVAALAPVVSEAETLAQRLKTEPLKTELFDAATKLEANWAKVRTGPGYDRARHDDFIIVFGSFVTRVKSAGLIWKTLNQDTPADASDAQGRQLELLFTLQSLHGAETSAQLVSRRGLEIDQLLSATNLVFEVTNGLAQAPEVLAGAVRLFRDLESRPTTP